MTQILGDIERDWLDAKPIHPTIVFKLIQVAKAADKLFETTTCASSMQTNRVAQLNRRGLRHALKELEKE